MISYLSYQNKKIYCRIIGKGKPVVLIHGFGETGDIWNNQIEFLKDRFQLIVPDLPGSGQSEMISDMSIEGMAECVHFIIHEEKIDQCSMIGHSMGGYISMAFAEKYPNHLDRLGLFHSTAFADSDEKKAIRRKSINTIHDKGAFEFLKNLMPGLFSEYSRLIIPGTIENFIDSLNNFKAETLVSYYEAMINRSDRTEILKKAAFPMLFIMGEHDKAVPLQEGLRQCHLPEKSYIYILRNSGHMGMLEEPGTCNKILDEFLQ